MTKPVPNGALSSYAHNKAFDIARSTVAAVSRSIMNFMAFLVTRISYVGRIGASPFDDHVSGDRKEGLTET